MDVQEESIKNDKIQTFCTEKNADKLNHMSEVTWNTMDKRGLLESYQNGIYFLSIQIIKAGYVFVLILQKIDIYILFLQIKEAGCVLGLLIKNMHKCVKYFRTDLIWQLHRYHFAVFIYMLYMSYLYAYGKWKTHIIVNSPLYITPFLTISNCLLSLSFNSFDYLRKENSCVFRWN